MKWSRAASGAGRPCSDATPAWADGASFRGTHQGDRGGRRQGNNNNRRLEWPYPALDSQDTYICCAYSPRCFIIQKVKPTSQGVEELPTKESPIAEEASSVASHDVSSPEEVTSVDRKTALPANGKGDTGSKVQVVFPAMEDTPGITTSLPSDATSSTATITLSTDPLTFHAQSHVEIYPSSTGQIEGDTQSGERPIPLPELKAMLQQQLEYYFSRENLATDAYLLSQMDSDQYVPIGTIAKFNQIRRLTEDINLIVEVLRESAFVQVDEAGEKVRPNQRSFVLILREIPETTPMKELEDLFSSENCPKFSRCEFAHNNSWYVLFESDEDTQKAYRYLREEAKTFKGKPIMARIKASSMTSAPFTHSYKNGICQPSEAEPYSAQQQMNQQQQQQQQQQAQVQYTYTNVAGDGYNNQQMCPPFYPPTMLQAWAPTTPACVDLGTVFSMNGLSPQAAFRPLNNTNRHNYSSRERQVKTYNPQNYNFTRTEQNSRFFSRNQSTSYLQRQQQQSFHNLMNTGFDYMPYASGSRSLHTFGMDVHNFFTAPNIYFRRLQGHSSLYPTHTSQARHNPMLLARNQVGLGAINSQDQNYLAVGGSVLPFTKDSVLSVTAAGVGKQNTDSQTKEPWGQSQRQRSKRWWKDSGGASTSSKSFEAENSNGLFNKSLSGGDGKPESPKFDLETTSFPPLPGCLDTDVLEVEVFESRLSDIVKGTVKPTTRDSKTQTSESALSPCAVMKDSSTLTIEETVVPPDIPDGAFTPPSSPVVIERVVSEVEEEIVLDSKPIDDWGEGEPLVDEPSEESLCITNISSTCPTTTTTSVTTTITTFTSVISPPLSTTSISSIITMTTTTTSVTATPTTCALVTSESEASTNVPIEASDVKQTPPKMPKNKQLDIMLPKIKPSELPSPKNKSPESAMLKNKLEIGKDKVPLPSMSKHKASSFPINKALESSSAKEKTNEFLSLNSKTLDITVSKTADMFSIKDKPIQVQLTKAKVIDSSLPKTKGPEAELPESLLSVNGHADSESAQSSEDEKPFRKLTYSEVAIRAKEKVEKLAQELKEKERQEALVRHLRQQELVAQNKQASSRGPFRDFPRGRVTDQQRPGYREWRERRKTTRAASLPSTGQ